MGKFTKRNYRIQKNRTISKVVIVVSIVLIALTILEAYHIKNNEVLLGFVQGIEKTHDEEIIQMDLREQARIQRELEEEEARKKRFPVLTDIGRENMTNIYTREEKVAYLTFDDGPSRTVTPLILDLLKVNDIKATFFVLGSRVVAYQDLLQREYDEGHFIANHGYSHVYSSIYNSPEAVLRGI